MKHNPYHGKNSKQRHNLSIGFSMMNTRTWKHGAAPIDNINQKTIGESIIGMLSRILIGRRKGVRS